MKEVNNLDWISLVLVIAGAINWGIEGLGQIAGRNLNPVDIIFNQALGIPQLEAIVYIFIGLAGLYQLYFGYELYEDQ